MFAALSRYLAHTTGPAGTLLVLDDLQWAGADALELLAALVREAAGAGMASVRVVGAYRETEVGPQDPLATHLADLARDGLVTRRRIGPLAHAEAAELLAGLLGEDVRRDSAQREQIVQRTGGVPYFLVSYTQVLLARRIAGSDSDDEEAIGAADREDVVSVPWTVAHSIRTRVGALPPESRELLGVATVVGRSIPADFLVAITARTAQQEEALVSALEAACAAGLLAMQGGDCQFTHDLIREVILADLGQSRARRLHRQVADALEQRPERGRHAAELAWHLLEAGVGARALPYALQAGDQAEAIYAHAEAERHYRGAVELARGGGCASGSGSVGEAGPGASIPLSLRRSPRRTEPGGRALSDSW